MIKYFVALWFLALPNFAQSQNWDYYEPLLAKGEIPAHFNEAFSQKFEREKEGISESDKRRTRKRKEAFHQQSEFFIDQYLTSGKVFFGDTITNYCRSVLDKVIGDNPELRKSISLYTVKTPIVNAAATANGIIFVNLGLIAKLETEAQLAYILSHELIHYIEGHVLDQYIETKKIENKEDLYRKTSDDEKIFKLSSYSKGLEFEADLKGLEDFYQKSGYSSNAPLEVMNVLLHSNLPFKELTFKKSFFNNGFYSFPDSYFMHETYKIEVDEDYDDRTSSHPNLFKRKEALKELTSDSLKTTDFLISEGAFKYCRNSARFELSRLYLNNRDYAKAIYHSYLLLEEFPNNRYLRLTIAKALCNLSVYMKDEAVNEVLEDYIDIQGESQQLYHFLNSCAFENDMAILATHYSYKLKQDYPKDEAIQKVFNASLKVLATSKNLSLDDFYSKESADSLNKRMDDEYWKFAFYEIQSDPSFVDQFQEYYDAQIAHPEIDFLDRSKSKKSNSTLALGIDKVTLVSPEYLKVNLQKDEPVLYLQSEEGLIRYKEVFQELSQKLELDVNMLDFKDGQMNVQGFNNLCLLKSWLNERYLHANHSALISDFDYTSNLREQLGSKYIISTSFMNLKEEAAPLRKIAYGIIVPFALPLVIMDLVNGEYYAYGRFVLFDLESGNALMARYEDLYSDNSSDYLKSIIYTYLHQVKSKKP